MAANAYVTPEHIRLFLLDRSAADNFLLDETDFKNESLDLMQELIVSRFNTTTPILNYNYTTEDFPYKHEFLMGVCGMLFVSKGQSMMRNALDYQSASGTAVNDKAKAEEYIKFGRELLQEFDDRVKKIKQHENIEGAYDFVSGPPRGLRY